MRKILYSFGFFSFACASIAADKVKQERPNIVWFLTEDLSPHYLALFNNGKGAETPNVRQMAEHGLIYTNAYSNAPVSSAARTTLITGCYAPRFAGSFHRRLQPLVMPEGLNMFPTYLRQAGYYTCNAQKTDYNVQLDKGAWDEIKGELNTWRNRPDKSKPFFFQRSNILTHESKLFFDDNTYRNVKTKNDPDKVNVHPSLADTKLVRYTYATFYDRINDSDRELGELIEMLREENVLDNTFIFYFGDNGGSLPGTKGYTDDMGIHVPLVVYIPEKWRDKIGKEYGSVEADPVSFMDFAPTVLNLAGINIPRQMDGKPFLGRNTSTKDNVVFGYGDRFDELYAFNRSVRKGKYRYARNFFPYHTQSLFAFYRYKQTAFREWKDLYEADKLNPVQSSFFEPFGPEELYNLENDPYETRNLVHDPQYKSVVAELRGELNNYLINKADLGFFPETIILEEAMTNPATYGEKNKWRIKSFVEIANLQTTSFSNDTEKRLYKALRSTDPVVRWWGLTTCAYFSKQSSVLTAEVSKLLTDERSFVRSRAMVLLSMYGRKYAKEDILAVLDNAKTGAETLLILNDLTYMVENELIKPFELKMNEIREECQGVDWRLKYLNSFVGTDNWKDRWKMIYNGEEQ
jgi:arylsulfatase A-like enzyme